MQQFLMAASVLAWLALASPALAQDRPDSSQTRTHVLRTRDGSTLVGRVVGQTQDSIRFESLGVVFALSRAEVLSLDTLGAKRVAEKTPHTYRDPNRTRLFFAPTARMLGKGEGYFSDTYVLLGGIAAGVTSSFTMGGGMSFIPSTNPQNNIFYLTPKVGLVDQPNFALAAGALIGFAGFDGIDSKDRSFGVLYGISTFGPEDHHLDIGAGWGYAGGRLSADPAVMIGGATRISRRVALLTENYIAPSVSDDGLVSYGIRFLGKDISVDLAFANAVGPRTTLLFPGVPYVAFAVKF